MGEKERYKLESYNEAFCQIHDTESDEWYLRKDLVKDLLNQQDKHIKELEDKLSEMQNEKDELISKYRYWREECAELKEQLAEHNEFFNAFNCKNFNEFKDFISTFMLTPHEEQTLIRELKQQLKDTEESYNNTMRYLNKTRSELLNLPKKIVEEIRTYCNLKEFNPEFVDKEHQECVVSYTELIDFLDTILKKYGGEDE